MSYIALDIGNVLCNIATEPFLETLSETLNITIVEANRFLKRFQQIHDLGYTTMEDELKDKFQLKSPITIAKLVQGWNDSVTPCIPMLTKLNDLRRENGLQVALLSNIGLEHASMMEEKLKHGEFFPGAIKHFSCFVGARKPSTIFYQSFLLQYPKFKNCLYIDDLQENLNSAKAFGFVPFHMSLELPGIDKKINEIENIILNNRWEEASHP